MCKIQIILIYLPVWSFWIEPEYTEYRNISKFLRSLDEVLKKKQRLYLKPLKTVDGWSEIVFLARV